MYDDVSVAIWLAIESFCLSHPYYFFMRPPKPRCPVDVLICVSSGSDAHDGMAKNVAGSRRAWFASKLVLVVTNTPAQYAAMNGMLANPGEIVT